MCQGSVKASICGGADASLLVQKLDGCLELLDSLRMAERVRLDAIPSADEALFNLGTFFFVDSRLFYLGGCHLSAVAELLRLVNNMEKVHTKVQGMISSHQLATTLIYDV